MIYTVAKSKRLFVSTPYFINACVEIFREEYFNLAKTQYNGLVGQLLLSLWYWPICNGADCDTVNGSCYILHVSVTRHDICDLSKIIIFFDIYS